MRQAGQLPVADLRPLGRIPRSVAIMVAGRPAQAAGPSRGSGEHRAGVRPLGTGPAAPNATCPTGR